jgi:hypothetical protein
VSSPLLRLPRDTRRSLAEGLESGRVAPPFSPFSLRRYVGTSLAADIAAELTRLGEAGFSAAQMGIVVRLLAEDAAEGARSAGGVELVWSGPEAAQERNIEAGALIDDAAFAQMLRLQFDGLVTARKLVRVPGL